MVLKQWSKKATFVTLITVCVLGSYCFSLWDIKFVTSTLVNSWTRTQKERLARLVWFSKKINTTVEADDDMDSPTFQNMIQKKPVQHQQDDTSQKPSPHKKVSQNTTLITTQSTDNATNFSPEVFFTTTTMTFNNTLVVECKQSPYTDCFPPNVAPITNKVFKITYVRRPKWLTTQATNMTNCKIDQCVIEADNDIDKADIVVINGVILRDGFGVPRRRPSQLLAIQIWEPPAFTYSGYIQNGRSPWNDRINIIISHRLDGNAFVPYNRLEFKPKPLDQRPNYYDIAKRKTGTAVWLVSHCKVPSKRDKYVREMQKYIDIDIFGKCGIPCKSKRKSCQDWTTKYKFYLAFENSLCTDYITEKFFKIFDRSIYMIPVVRGGADYDRHFPNFTYINSAHFKTPKDLALHLKHLASDLETYSKYLEYKDLYTTVPYKNAACKLCTFLHTHKLPNPSQTYNLTSLLGFQHCHNPKDLE